MSRSVYVCKPLQLLIGKEQVHRAGVSPLSQPEDLQGAGSAEVAEFS
jgi:hypothetical protein